MLLTEEDQNTIPSLIRRRLGLPLGSFLNQATYKLRMPFGPTNDHSPAALWEGFRLLICPSTTDENKGIHGNWRLTEAVCSCCVGEASVLAMRAVQGMT